MGAATASWSHTRSLTPTLQATVSGDGVDGFVPAYQPDVAGKDVATKVAGLSIEQAGEIVKKALSSPLIKGAPRIRLTGPDDPPLPFHAPANSKGFLHGDDIYLFPSRHSSALDLEQTVFHEVFHGALRRVMSQEDYFALKELMEQTSIDRYVLTSYSRPLPRIVHAASIHGFHAPSPITSTPYEINVCGIRIGRPHAR